MDDGGIVGDVELLQKVWKLLVERGPEMGLELNPSKCEWTWLNPGCKEPCPIKQEGVPDEHQVKLVPHDKIEMLGVPLGDRAFTSKFIEGDLQTRLKPVLERLEEFEDTQAALYLLRVSFSIVRATHHMRTTPLEQWKEHAEAFDTSICSTVQKILGVVTEPVRKQASFTPKLGGLGLRRTVDHANFSFHASWHEGDRRGGLGSPGRGVRIVRPTGNRIARLRRSSARDLGARSRASGQSPRRPTPSTLRPTPRERVHHGNALPARRVRHGPQTEDRSHRGTLPTGGPRHPQGDFLPFVHADHQRLWRSRHLLLKVRRPHCPP